MTLNLWFGSRMAAVALLSAGSFAGCNMNKITANMTAGPIRMGSIALDRESDLLFAEQAIPGPGEDDPRGF